MESSNSIRGEARNITDFFSQANTKLQIPLFQRSYAWKNEHIEQWLEDIISFIDSDDEYFIGPLIYQSEEDNKNKIKQYLILDGQQRLTTTFLIYFLMIKIYNEKSSKNPKIKNSEFETNVFSLTSFTTRGKQFDRISLNKHDSLFFKRLIRDKNTPTSTEKSHDKILDAYNQIEKSLRKEFKDNGGVDRFLNIHYALSDKFIFMSISVDNKIDAYKLFEAMNDKGLKLSQTDLIKNYIFSMCPNNEDELHDYWTTIQKNIKTSDYDFDVFIQYYWDGEYEEVRKNEVYKKFTKKCNTDTLAFDEVQKMAECSKYLDMFINPEEYEPEHWALTDRETKEEIYQIIEQIKSFDIKQIHILIIQLFKYATRGDNSEDQIKDLILPYLKEIRNFLFRYSVVCGKGSNRVLSRFGYAAREMNFNGPDFQYFLDEMEGKNRKNLINLIPRNSEFETNFYTFKSTNKVSKSIIKAIYPLAKGTSYKTAIVELEHIIPIKWDTNKKWADYLKLENDKYNKEKKDSDKKTLENYCSNLLNRIGNHVLLVKDENIIASNDFYTAKYKIYKKNSFPNTNTLPDRYSKWNEESIEKRTREILDLLNQNWKLS